MATPLSAGTVQVTSAVLAPFTDAVPMVGAPGAIVLHVPPTASHVCAAAQVLCSCHASPESPLIVVHTSSWLASQPKADAVGHGQLFFAALPQPGFGSQLPDEHCLPAAQVEPFATSPVALHTEAPVAQEVVPVLHGMFATGHAVPCVHEHEPAAQARLAPQVVPLSTGVLVSVHTGEPVAHDWVPLWQIAFGGVQGVPSMQVTHDPDLQTWPWPHIFPSEALPVFMQTEPPVSQAVTPVSQTLPFGWQTWPALHATQLPPLQTRS